MPNTSTRLALQEPIGADTVNELRLAITNLATTLDNSAIWATPTTLGARPAANTYKAGTLHRATDSGVVSIGDGAAWHVLAADNQGPPVGSIQAYAGGSNGTGDPVDPDGTTRWVICDGRSLARSGTYASLFAVLSTTYGSADGTHFNIPDMRGRTAIGAGTGSDNSDGTHVNGPTSTTLSNRVLGTLTGEENHPLTTAELAAHDHGSTGPGTVATNTVGNHSHSGFTGFMDRANPHGHSFSVWVTAGPSDIGNVRVNLGGSYNVPWSNSTGFSAQGGSANAADINHLHGISPDGSHSHTLTSAGSGTKHNSVQPSLVLNYIIRVL